MALSGTAYSNKRGGWQLKMTWTGTQNITANNTAIHWTVALVADATWRINAMTAFSGSITINGTKTAFSKNPSTAGGTTMTLGSGTTTVGHNADGTKSTTIAFSYYLGIYSGSLGGTVGTLSGSSAVSLNTIPRRSSFITSTATVEMGTTMNVYITPAASTFTHKLRYVFGRRNDLIKDNPATLTTFQVVFPTATYAPVIPGATTGVGSLVLDTYNGSTLIGSATMKITLTVPASVVPTIDTVTHTETITRPNIATAIGGYVQGYSILALAATATGIYGSTIKNYAYKLGAASYTGQNVLTGVMTSMGDMDLVTTITDSRGRTASSTQTVTVLAYVPPAVSMFIERSDEAGEPLDEGTFADINLVGTTTALNDRNAQTIKLEYAIQGSDTWTEIPNTITDYVYDKHVIVPGMDVDKAYIFRVSVQDTFLASTVNGSVATAFTTVDYRAGGGGVAFGQVATHDGVWVGKRMPLNVVADPDETGSGHVMTVKANTGLDLLAITIDANSMLALNGRALIDMFYPVGTIYESTAPENPSNFIGGEWERFGNGRVTIGVEEEDTALATPNLQGGSINPLTSHSHKGPLIGTNQSYFWAWSGGSTEANSIRDLNSNVGAGAWSGGNKQVTIQSNVGNTTQTTGSNTNHANWQPFATVFRWRRTA